LKPVIVEVAAQPHGGQHQDGPVVHSFPSAFGAGVPIDIASHRPENVITQLALYVDVLQCHEDGYDFIAAVEVQGHVDDRRAIQPLLAIEGFPHGTCSSKIVACLIGTPRLFTRQARKRSHLRGGMFQEIAEKTGPTCVMGRRLVSAAGRFKNLNASKLLAAWRRQGVLDGQPNGSSAPSSESSGAP
jgi:hypothetical protein